MAAVAWTEEAERWLRDIHAYIAKENPRAAAQTVEGIHRKVHLLSEFPELGFRYQHAGNRNIRILLYGHYRIVYLIKPDRDVDILGVFHAALDIDRYLI